MIMPGYWLVKSINRFSMSPPSHKGFFSSSYNLEKKFGTLFSGHSFTQLANRHTYIRNDQEALHYTETRSMETETCRHCIFTHQMKLQLNIYMMYIRIVNDVRGKVIWHSTAVAKTVLRISIYRHVHTVCSINVINGPVILLVSIHT